MQDNIIIDYYISAYGPCLRVDVQSNNSLEMLREMFSRLANGDIGHFDMQCLPGVIVSGFKTLKVQKTDRRIPSDAQIQVLNNKNENYEFLWQLTEDAIQNCIGLIDGLYGDEPGHQYLTKENDKVLIELAYKE